MSIERRQGCWILTVKHICGCTETHAYINTRKKGEKAEMVAKMGELAETLCQLHAPARRAV